MKILARVAVVASALLISVVGQEKAQPSALNQIDRAWLRPLAEIGKKPVSFYCADFIATIAFDDLYKKDALCSHARFTFAVNRVPIVAKQLGEPSDSPGHLRLVINAAPWRHSSNGNPDFFTYSVELEYVESVVLPKDVVRLITASRSPKTSMQDASRMSEEVLIPATLWHEEKTGVFSEPPHPGEFESIIDNVLNKFVIDYEKAKSK